MSRGKITSEYDLKLFVTGMSVASVKAIANIKSLCDHHLQDKYTLEIIDIYKHPEVLQQYDVIACPTLIKLSPAPLKKLIGDLSDKNKVLKALQISIE
jgi:circadian clock protein KaiB